MIESLAELNRVLLVIQDLSGDEQAADIEAVIEHCKGTVIEARMPDHGASISFAAEVGLLKVDGTEVRVTPEGAGFIELNPTSQYDLAEPQKKLLLRMCYLHGPLRKQSRAVLKEFSQALDGETLRWSAFDSSPLPNEWAADHLRQLGLLRRREDGWEVSGEFARTVSIFLEEGTGFSEEKLREYLKEKEEVGKLGESLVKEFEIRRLSGLGHGVEAKCVRGISNVRVNAGYDIESFDAASPAVIYDRFIEVKGAKARQLRFFWSDNEISVAKRLGKQYWIYFQGSIDAKKGIARDEPILLHDPANSILADNRFKKSPQGLIVESSVTGTPRKN